MRRTPLLVLATLVTLVLALSGSGAAQARPKPDHVSVKDKAGDAPAGIDLLSGKYSISKQQATFEVKVKKLTETTFLAFEIWPLIDAWDRVAVYREKGRTVGKVYFVDNDLEFNDEPEPVLKKCPGLKVTWSFATDRVSVTVPNACLQATSKDTAPFEFHTFTRFGGSKGSAHDAMPAKTLDY
jgi:hypothetical protein